MANVNKAIVMGVLGRDSETKHFPSGGSVTNFKRLLNTGKIRPLASVKVRQNGIELAPTTDWQR